MGIQVIALRRYIIAGYHKYKVHPSNGSTQFIGHRLVIFFSYAITGCGEMVIINSG